MKTLLICFSALILFSCNNNKTAGEADAGEGGTGAGKKGWTAKLRKKYIEECKEAAGGANPEMADKICDCAMEKVEKKYTPEQAEKLGEEEGQKLAMECLGMGGGDDNYDGGRDDEGGDDNYDGDDRGSGGGKWSSSDKRQFVQPCEAGLQQSGYSSSQARQMCNCVVERLQKKYSSLEEANSRGGSAAGETAMRECMSDN